MTENKTEFQVNDIVKIRGGQAHWVVTDTKSFKNIEYPIATYLQDGSSYTRYFSAQDIELVTKAKRKVKKTIEGWVNVYEKMESGSVLFTDESTANCASQLGRKRIACVHMTGSYEVEE